jgi:hypothetical protein
MRIQPVHRSFCFWVVCGTSLLAGSVAYGAPGKLGPVRDARAGILDSSLVVIVKQQKPDSFKIERVFLGRAPSGGTISLPGFKLFENRDEGPDVVEAITPSTRILLFLNRSAKNPQDWVVTQEGNCFFWVNDPGQAARLEQIASAAIRLRRAWEAARDTRDLAKRVNALWPYLWEEDRYFFKATLAELMKLGSVSGDFIASRFDSLSALQRKMLFGYMGAFGGNPLHQAVVAYIKKAEAPGSSGDHRNTAPRPAGTLGGRTPGFTGTNGSSVDTDMSISDGLEGLISFKDHADLPYIRDLALSAVAKGYRQTCYSALSAFARMPDRDNLPVIDEIRRASANQMPLVVAVTVITALSAHRYAETVPQLAFYLDDKNSAPLAQRYLSEIVGKDLGRNKQSWLDWYSARAKTNQEGRR